MSAGRKILASALWYAGTAGFSVFPCHSASGGACSCGDKTCRQPGKHPRTAHGFKDATKDATVIRAWWAQWPGANIGIATGTISGIVVLDADPKNDGDESRRELEKKHGDFPLTPQVISGSLGTHDYFRLPPGVTIGRMLGVMAGIDILGDNGYVIAPPSMHVSGRAYVWELTRRINEIPLADAPTWLLAFAKEKATGATSGTPSVLPSKIPEGQRNNALISYLGTARKRGADEAELVDIGIAFCEHRMSPPLPADEIRKAAKSICRYKPTAPVSSTLDTMKAEDVVALGGQKLDEIVLKPREEILSALRDVDTARAIFAFKKSRLADYMAGAEKIKPASLRTSFDQIVRDAGKSAPKNGKAHAKSTDEARAEARRSVIHADDSRPEVDLATGDLEDHVSSSLAALKADNQNMIANGPSAEGAYFSRGGLIVRVTDCDGTPGAHEVFPDAMALRLAQCVRYVSWKENTRGEPRMSQEYPPPPVARGILSMPGAGLPRLVAICRHPVIVPNSDKYPQPLTRCGYNPERGILLYGFDPSWLPETATQEDARAAARWINDEIFCDFPFSGPSERATAFALMVLPFIRPVIDGCTPLHLVEASVQGSGKDLLINTCLRCAMGNKLPSSLTQGRDEDEWRKRITTYLRTGTESIAVRNLRGHLQSATLEAVLTLPQWEDRQLGNLDLVSYPNLAVWAGSGNNVSLSEDMARRVIRCMLTPDVEKPGDRTGFRHEHLLDWMAENRPEVLRMAWTIVLGWARAGAPTSVGPLLGSYESWAQNVGGVLQFCGVDGFLGNRHEVLEGASEDQEAMRSFVNEWYRVLGDKHVTVDDLYPLAQLAGIYIKGHQEPDRKKSVTWAIRGVKNRIIAGYFVRYSASGENAATPNRTTFWLERQD